MDVPLSGDYTRYVLVIFFCVCVRPSPTPPLSVSLNYTVKIKPAGIAS